MTDPADTASAPSGWLPPEQLPPELRTGAPQAAPPAGAPAPPTRTPAPPQPPPPVAQAPQTAQPAAPPPRPPGSRTRAWLALLSTLAVLTAYLAVIGYFLNSHTLDRAEQLPPGATQRDDTAERTVVALQLADSVPDPYDPDDEPTRAGPGEVLIVATVRVSGVDPENPYSYCTMDVLGPDNRRWEARETVVLGAEVEKAWEAPSCGDLRPGEPVEVQLVYAIPERFVDSVYGLVIDSYSSEPDFVLTPPR